MTVMFQSPSLRGSGRFRRVLENDPSLQGMFQSPSLRGSGRFLSAHLAAWRGGKVSIPFIAGQWSLRVEKVESDADGIVSQSPSLRGSGRFLLVGLLVHGGGPVSIPFIAGQWSLLTERLPPPKGGGGLNPLHCGAVVASNPPAKVR